MFLLGVDAYMRKAKKPLKSESQRHKRISTTLSPVEHARAAESKQTYRQLIVLGLAHLDQMPKVKQLTLDHERENEEQKKLTKLYRRQFFELREQMQANLKENREDVEKMIADAKKVSE